MRQRLKDALSDSVFAFNALEGAWRAAQVRRQRSPLRQAELERIDGPREAVSHRSPSAIRLCCRLSPRGNHLSGDRYTKSVKITNIYQKSSKILGCITSMEILDRSISLRKNLCAHPETLRLGQEVDSNPAPGIPSQRPDH